MLPAAQLPSAIAPDGTGGALLVWLDYRNGGTGGTSEDLYAQRVLADGTLAPGWPVNGAPVSRGPDFQDLPVICSDGAGGMFVAWQDWRSYATPYGNLDVYAQHLTAAGVPAPGWPANGLPVCTDPNPQGGTMGLVPDGTGGVAVVWNDLRRGVIDVYAQHLLADGAIAPGWVADGVPVVLGRTRAGAVADGADGFYVPCATLYPSFGYAEYYVQRFTFAGSRAPGWPEGGVRACGAPDRRDGLQFSTDGQGGVLLAWTDWRPGNGSGESFVTRHLPDGSLAPGWTVEGTRVSNPGVFGAEYFEFDGDLASDGLGGAYVVWQRALDTGNPSFVQHLTAQGAVAPGWPLYGVQLAPTTYQWASRITSDGAGGAIVAWDDEGLEHSIYAQRFVVDGPVAVAVSLVSAEATSDRVTLVWHEAGERLAATLYRHEADGEWTAIARLDPDGEGLLRYEDRDVTPGTRYAYRLGIVDSGIETLLGEVSVEVPAVSQFALRGVSPHPAVGDLHVAFSLAGSAPARLELLDIAGRRVKSEEVGSLGAGHHVLNLNRDGQLAAGMYLVRLTQGARTATARAIVVR